MNDIAFASATDIAQKIRNQEISCVEILQVYLDRIDRYNEGLNAVVVDVREQALAEARQHARCHVNAVRQVLQRRRDERELPPPLPLTLPDNDKARNIRVRAPSLAAYDQPQRADEHDDDGHEPRRETPEPDHDQQP